MKVMELLGGLKQKMYRNSPTIDTSSKAPKLNAIDMRSKEPMYGDTSHPFIPHIHSLLAKFRCKLNYFESDRVTYKSFCNLGLLSVFKLNLSRIFSDIITMRIVSNNTLVSESVYDTYKDLNKYMSYVDSHSEYYNHNTMRLFCTLFIGVFRQDLKAIDKILVRDDIPQYMKAVEISDILVSTFKAAIVTFNNLQIPCHLIEEKTCREVTAMTDHNACNLNANTTILLLISDEHFYDSNLLINIIKELARLKGKNILLFIDFSRVKEFTEIPMNKLTIRLMDIIRSYRVYYITNSKHMNLSNIFIMKDVFLSSNIEFSLAIDYWKLKKERYPVSSYKEASTFIANCLSHSG